MTRQPIELGRILINSAYVGFSPKGTELPGGREMTKCADFVAEIS